MRSTESLGAKDHSSALKFVYKAQAILLSAQNNAVRIPSDVGLATNLVTFLLLWKVKKYHEAYGYAQICSNRVKNQGQGLRSAAAYRTYLNLTGIIVMAVSGCYLKVEKDTEKAIRTLENVLMELRDWDLPVVRLMMEMLGEVQRLGDESDTSFEGAGEGSGRLRTDMRLPEPVISTQDFLATSEYLSLVFITVFLPFISTFYAGPTTPLIRRMDLEDSRRREPSIHSSERSDEFLRILASQGDSYVLTMNSIVAVAKVNKDPDPPPLRLISKVRNRAAERIKRYRKLLDPRKVHDFTRDWTTAQFHAPKYVVPRLDQRHESLPPSKVASHFTSPRRKIVTEKQLLPTKRRGHMSTDPKKHIMVEFTPSRLAQDNEFVPVNVIPMATSRLDTHFRRKKRKLRAKIQLERLENTMRIERQEGVSISPKGDGRESVERSLNVSVL